MRASSILIVLLSLGVGVAPSAGQGVYRGSGFQLSVPEAWHQIPDSLIEYNNARVSDASGQTVTYLAGFQPEASSEWFQFPYALLQIGTGGAPPSEEAFARAMTGGAVERSVARMNESGGAAKMNLRDASTARPWWDDELHAAFIPSSSTRADGVTVFGLSAMRLSRSGGCVRSFL